MIRIEFDTRGPAFANEPSQECIWVLQLVQQALRAGSVTGKCLDSNGVEIGTWELTADRD